MTVIGPCHLGSCREIVIKRTEWEEELVQQENDHKSDDQLFMHLQLSDWHLVQSLVLHDRVVSVSPIKLITQGPRQYLFGLKMKARNTNRVGGSGDFLKRARIQRRVLVFMRNQSHRAQSPSKKKEVEAIMK